jgi:RNA polymerase sigma-70 factor (ECF subfamily)
MRPIPLHRGRAEAGPSDASLVAAARAGEAWAREALFSRHARLVHGLAFRLMGSDADVDDLAQDAFVEALRGLDRLADPSAFSSWLGAIVVRTAHKRLRRRRLMARFGLRAAQPIDVEALPLRSAPPEAALELKRLYGVLDAMEPEERIALVLRRVEGLELQEIAERMALSLATVKRRIASAEACLGRAKEGP